MHPGSAVTAPAAAPGGTRARRLQAVPDVATAAESGRPGRPVPGSPGWTYEPGVGVWRQGDAVLTWCPIVTAQAMRLDEVTAESLGGTKTRISSRKLSVVVGDELATVAAAEVAKGEVWGQYTRAVGVGDRTVRDVLRNIVDDQANSLPRSPLVARWVGGRLTLPGADMMPRGYGQVAGTAEDWRELLRVAGQSGRLALSAGLALAGLYVRPLARQSYMVHIVGLSSAGKTTAQRVAASVFGDPTGVILSWSVTKQGPGAWLRDLELLTGFRNDIGAAQFTPADLERNVLSWMEGAERDRSSRTGSHESTPGSWHGCLSSTGNDGIVGQVQNSAIAARVVEIAAPLTLSKEHAADIKALTLRTYGHGLAALIDRGPAPEEFAGMIARALVDIGAADLDGVAGRAADSIAGGVAGTRLLADLAGCPEFAAGVVDGARAVLAGMAADLAERGAGVGDRLLTVLAEHMSGHPAEWPTRNAYVDTLREVSGWDLRGVADIPGEVAAIPGRLREIARAAGITDVDVAITDLARRGLVVSKKGRRYPVKVGGKVTWCYLITRLGQEEDPTPAPTPAPAPGPAEVDPHPTLLDTGPAEVERDLAVPAGPCAACQVAGESCGIVGAGDRVPCACCGGLAVGRTRCGVTRHHVCRGAGVDRGQVERAEVEQDLAVPTQRAEAVPAEDALDKMLTGAYPGSNRAERAEAGRLWSRYMRGITFRGPHVTARAILGGALKHHAIPALAEVDPADLAELWAAPRWRGRTWVVPGVDLAAGQGLAAADVNGMYLGAAEVELGTGAPEWQDGPATAAMLKRPGWVRLATAPADLPHGLAGRIVAGMWVPNPIAVYLAKRVGPLDVDRSVTWPDSRRWLRPHVGLMRDARAALLAASTRPGDPADMALAAVKQVYARMFGGLLRSAKHNDTPTMRPDWAALIEATGQARMFRALDRADVPAIGVHVDAVWLAVPAGDVPPTVGAEPVEWHGLTIGRQLGKFKPAGVAVVDAAMVDAYGRQVWKPIHSALKQ
jgi:hypothetical protein